MNHLRVKTAELTGAALRWVVAKAEGQLENREVIVIGKQLYGFGYDGDRVLYEPDYDWSQGGPIKERECISTRYERTGLHSITVYAEIWPDYSLPCIARAEGPTELIAAMRCYVASKLGGEVEIPEELLK